MWFGIFTVRSGVRDAVRGGFKSLRPKNKKLENKTLWEKKHEMDEWTCGRMDGSIDRYIDGVCWRVDAQEGL